MTDRVKGCTVAFEKDIRIDDVEVIIDAIKMIRGIENVELHIANSSDWINRQQVKSELREGIFNLFKNL